VEWYSDLSDRRAAEAVSDGGSEVEVAALARRAEARRGSG
jgi:hypothetical protein